MNNRKSDVNVGTDKRIINAKNMFQKTLIIGLGLIGGSFAKALKKNNLSKEIFACDTDLETIDYAKNSEIIKDGFTNLSFFSEDLFSFDFIVVAAPISAYDEIFFELKNVRALVIDLGSVKELDVENLPKNFIPCHPVAGSENTGFENADADLFSGKKFILCKESLEVVEIAKKIGAIPDFLEAKKHDEIYALVSHLPQFLSFLTAEFSPKKITEEFFQKAFRLDNSDPELWSEIFAMNEKNLEKFYEKFFENLEKICNGNTLEMCGDLDSSTPLQQTQGEQKFFEENFSTIFFRSLVVKSFLEIPEIKTFQSYAGMGFKDFTSIISVLSYNAKKLETLFEENRKKILKFFDSLQ
ncbi:MAG: prephenate dehydrogenase/arogenate dehydrogenase family protein [Proteobacteria bacterium]|nr:prephenate dehydrogenase/arogenate dehydrogenase family protein [Pseudomonadota bacterium]